MVIGIIALVVVLMLVAGFIGFVVSGDGFGFIFGAAVVFQLSLMTGVIAVVWHFVAKYW